MNRKKQSTILDSYLVDLHKSLNKKLNQALEATKDTNRDTLTELINLRNYYASEDKKLRERYRTLVILGAKPVEINQIVDLVRKIDKLYHMTNGIIKEIQGQRDRNISSMK